MLSESDVMGLVMELAKGLAWEILWSDINVDDDDDELSFVEENGGILLLLLWVVVIVVVLEGLEEWYEGKEVKLLFSLFDKFVSKLIFCEIWEIFASVVLLCFVFVCNDEDERRRGCESKRCCK